MTAREQLMKEIEQAPEPLVEEVLHFLLFIKDRRDRGVSEPDSNGEADINQVTEATERNNRPIWDLFEDFTKDLPEEVLAKLPTDGAQQHDYYLYGTPKRQFTSGAFTSYFNSRATLIG
jgi:hypothetical protein